MGGPQGGGSDLRLGLGFGAGGPQQLEASVPAVEVASGDV